MGKRSVFPAISVLAEAEAMGKVLLAVLLFETLSIISVQFCVHGDESFV